MLIFIGHYRLLRVGCNSPESGMDGRLSLNSESEFLTEKVSEEEVGLISNQKVEPLNLKVKLIGEFCVHSKKFVRTHVCISNADSA